jgi:hypothetical protein
MPIGSSKLGVLGAGLVPGGTETFNAPGTFSIPPGVKIVSDYRCGWIRATPVTQEPLEMLETQVRVLEVVLEVWLPAHHRVVAQTI